MRISTTVSEINQPVMQRETPKRTGTLIALLQTATNSIYDYYYSSAFRLKTQHWKNITVTNITITLLTLWWLELLSISLRYGVEEYPNGVWSYSSNCARKHSWVER
jgi:hypothetical protein